MSTDNGWVRIFRSVTDHEIWNKKPFSYAQAWIDMIMMAEFRETSFIIYGKTYSLHRGQIKTTLRELTGRWGWGKKSVLVFLDYLKNQRMIKVKTYYFGSVITIVNYDRFQGERFSTEPQSGSHTEPQKGNLPIIEKDKEYIAPFGAENTQSDESTYQETEGWYDP